MTAAHEMTLHQKQGNAWTNDLGQTFPAVPLYRCSCSCGWQGAAWYASVNRATGHYGRHFVAAVAS